MLLVHGITVGISTLERPAALARCLDAVLSGRQLPAEIVVVDQGTEQTATTVVRERIGLFPGLRHVRQQRRGLSAARNAMLLHARHPILAVTDDDCVPDPEWVAAIADAFARAPEPDAITGSVLPLAATPAAPHAISSRSDPRSRDFTEPVIPWHVGTGGNFAVRRDVALAIGGYDERLGAGSAGQAGEDIELLLRLLRSGARVRYEPEAIVYHETQTDARRLATRWSYAYGIGALAGMLGRGHDRFGLTILRAAMRNAVGRLARAVHARDRFGVRQALLSIVGTLRGLAYGWRAASRPRHQLPLQAGIKS